jgi:hypothetical protein
MPNIDIDKLEEFVADLVQSRAKSREKQAGHTYVSDRHTANTFQKRKSPL